MAEIVPWAPMSDDHRATLHRNIDRLVANGEAIGGFTTKSESRLTGASLHCRFERRTDIAASMEFVNLLCASPAMLANACARLLGADDEIRRLTALLADQGETETNGGTT